MLRRALWGLLALVLAVPATAQTPADTLRIELVRTCGMAKAAETQLTKALAADTTSDLQRIELVRSRGFIRGSITQCAKSLAIFDGLGLTAPPPIGEPIDTLPPPPQPPRLLITQGQDQSAPAGSAVPVELVVEVRDSAGSPLADYPLLWRASDGGRVGGLWVRTSDTDSVSTTTPVDARQPGRSFATWYLGTKVGSQVLVVDGGAAGTVTFRATATDTVVALPPAYSPDSLPVGVESDSVRLLLFPRGASSGLFHPDMANPISMAAGDSLEACIFEFGGPTMHPGRDVQGWHSSNPAVVAFGTAPATRGTHCTWLIAQVSLDSGDLQQMGFDTDLTLRVLVEEQ